MKKNKVYKILHLLLILPLLIPSFVLAEDKQETAPITAQENQSKPTTEEPTYFRQLWQSFINNLKILVTGMDTSIPIPVEDYFDMLEISQNATVDEIKAAYDTQIALLSFDNLQSQMPDIDPQIIRGTSDKYIKQLNEAKAILLDTRERRLYKARLRAFQKRYSLLLNELNRLKNEEKFGLHSALKEELAQNPNRYNVYEWLLRTNPNQFYGILDSLERIVKFKEEHREFLKKTMPQIEVK